MMSRHSDKHSISAAMAISLLSVVIIARNEEEALPALLRDIKKQSFPRSQTEILLIDSMSSDATLDIMEEFRQENQQFYKVKVLQNPDRYLPHGCNLALDEYSGDAMVRIDAHATIPEDFLEASVNALNQGYWVAGGRRETILKKNGLWRSVLLAAENSVFGSGGASYRRKQNSGYVKSVFHGAYRREVFDRVGNYDQRLLRTEDNDMSYRIRQAGYQIFFDPEIVSFQHIRDSLLGFLRQKAANGYWVGRTLPIQPACIGLFNLVPAVFCIAIVLAIILALFGLCLPLLVLILAYLLACVVGTVLSFKADSANNWRCITLPFLFLAMHLGYGFGSILGLISGIIKK
ncbi:glycosyl transferase [Actinomycetota bacterium]|nr:glycosyl transferase [Actinomycetota bacterium]